MLILKSKQKQAIGSREGGGEEGRSRPAGRKQRIKYGHDRGGVWMHHKLQSIIDQFLSFTTPASNQRMTGS